MEYYVGLDVSLKQTSICVVDQSGSVVREGVVDSDPEAISVYVRSKAPGAVRIGLETGPTSTWLWTELKRLGLPVICIDARHAKAVLKMFSHCCVERIVRRTKIPGDRCRYLAGLCMSASEHPAACLGIGVQHLGIERLH